jgi:hypothetical protein
VKRWRELADGEICTDAPLLRTALRRLYPPLAEARGMDPRYHFTAEQLEALTDDPTRAKLIGVIDKNSEVRFVRLFLYTQHWADAFIEAQRSDSEADSRPVYWAGYLWAHDAGIPYLNLSGGLKAGDGMDFFKRSLGGDALPLLRASWVLDQAAYEAECKSRGFPPSIVGGYFPAYAGPHGDKISCLPQVADTKPENKQAG